MTPARLLSTWVLVVAGLSGSLAVAAEPAAAPTRSPEAILDDYAKAVGGQEGLGRHRNVYLRRQVSVKAMGVEGSEERWATSAGKFVLNMTLPGIGTMKSGSTGGGASGVRWSEDPINGLRVLKGAEDEQTRIEATWNAELQLKKLFKERKTVPVPAGAPKGAPLECVLLTAARTSPITMCFDAVTHLRRYQEGKQVSPQGEVPYVVRVSDWREVEGVKLPYTEEITAGPMTMEAKILEVKFDGPVDPKLFKMPKPAKP